MLINMVGSQTIVANMGIYTIDELLIEKEKMEQAHGMEDNAENDGQK